MPLRCARVEHKQDDSLYLLTPPGTLASRAWKFLGKVPKPTTLLATALPAGSVAAVGSKDRLGDEAYRGELLSSSLKLLLGERKLGEDRLLGLGTGHLKELECLEPEPRDLKLLGKLASSGCRPGLYS